MQSKHIVGLDFVRFFAAVLVMFSHLFYSTWIAPTISQPPGALTPVWSFPAFGWIGVQIFFVLSGFVISYTANQATPFSFFASRVVRLVPGAWICATITFFVLLAIKTIPPEAALMRWITTIAFSPKPPFIDNVYWTLGIEIFFYGLIFLLLCFNQFKRVEFLAIVLATITVLFWVIFDLTHTHFLDQIRGSRDFTILLVRHGCFFALGIMLWLCVHRVTPLRLTVIAACMGGGILQIIDEHGEQPPAPGLNHTPILAVAVWLAALCAIVASIYFRDRIRPARWIRTLGLMTYPLYLVHNVVGAAVIRKISAIGPVLAVCITMVLAVALSWLITTTLERMGQKALRRLLDEPRMMSKVSMRFLFARSESPLT